MDTNQVPPNTPQPTQPATPAVAQPLVPPPQVSAPPAPPAPPISPTTPPKESNKTLILILALVGGILIVIVVLIMLLVLSSTRSSKKAAESTSTNSTASNAEPTLPSGYVPINTPCYRVAAPTNNSLDNDNTCNTHVDYGHNKTGSYMIVRLTGSDNATSVASWKKINNNTVVSEENVKVDGFDGVKIVYQRPVGSKTVKGVIVFVATPTKNYMDGTFNIPGFEASSAFYEDDDSNSKEVFDTLINTWHWK